MVLRFLGKELMLGFDSRKELQIDKYFTMAANGISTLATKELKQIAKLDLAATDRTADGNPRDTYDITELPTQYSGNTIVDNPNVGGLIHGRPWN